MAGAARELLPPERRHDETRATPIDVSVRSIALTIIAGTAAMYVLQWAQEVFIPIVLSLLISYALEPPVLWLMRVRLPRIVASGVVVMIMAGALGYGAYTLSDEATAIVGTLPDAAQKLRQAMRRPRGEAGAIQQVQQAAEELQKTADEATGRNPAARGVP
jgi:predicted PurR-regulated permease PerM